MASFFSAIGSYFGGGFTADYLTFDDVGQVMTTALIAEGGYSFVYAAREVAGAGRQFAAKKVLVQDPETRAIAETTGRRRT